MATPSAPAPAAKAAGDLAPGRYAVQVAVFMTPAFAETRRSRLVGQLQANAMPEADATRVVARDDRYFVVVGDVADRAQAEALAARLRAALRQDVVVFRR
jgi:cell division protein FtsN